MKATLNHALKVGTFVLAAADSDKPRRFDINAYDGGPLPVSGFEHPVIVDLSSLQYPQSIPLLIDHTASVEATLGSTDLIENDGQELRMSGLVTATSDMASQVVEQHDKGQQWQASIGVRVGDVDEIQAGEIVVVNKQQFRGPVLVARNSQMYETSVLPAGADWTTKVNLAATAATSVEGMATMPTFEEWLVSLGLDQSTLDEDNMAALMLAFDARQNPEPSLEPASPEPVPSVVSVPAAVSVEPVAPALTATAIQEMQDKAVADVQAAMRTGQAAELNRQQSLSVIAGKYPKILATAIAQNWDETKTENAVLKEDAKIRTPQTKGGASTGVDTTPLVLEAAICMARKVPGHEQQYDDQTLQAAHSTFGRGGIGLQQLLLMAAAANGYNAGPGERVGTSNLRSILRAAFPHNEGDLQAAFSTVSLPGILGNIANKELLAGYEADDQLMLWRRIAEVKSVSDFKTVTSYRMLDSLAYEQLGPGGKIKHGTLGQESYTRAASTYAKMFSLTRTDIINDDLGAFDDLRKRLGMGAAQKLSDVFWTTFLDNAAFFTSARANYIEGATTNLGTDGVGLQLGLDAFRTLRSPAADGAKRIGGDPQLLLVPTELSVTAERFFVNQNLGAGTTVAEANIYANKYEPVVVPWLSDSAFANSSATAWYLLRDPAKYASMVVSFLDGVEQPTVESAEANFESLGVDFRGYHDFGCDEAEYLAGTKSKGAA